MRENSDRRDHGWTIALAGVLAWIVALALRGPDIMSFVLGAGVLVITYVLCARRWRPQAVPAAWRGPTTTPSGLLLLGLALGQVGLELRPHRPPILIPTGLFIIALTLLIGSVIAAFRSRS